METPVELAQRIAHNPDAASDSEKLRSIADWIDVQDAKNGLVGRTEAQDFLRGLAERLEEA
jgi:hypothetical protein